MEVLEITEQEDGSAIIELEMTEEEKHLLIEVGFITMMKKGMETHEDNFRATVSE